jgi:hypothetical protein
LSLANYVSRHLVNEKWKAKKVKAKKVKVKPFTPVEWRRLLHRVKGKILKKEFLPVGRQECFSIL